MKHIVNCRAYVFDPATRTYGIAAAFDVEHGAFQRIGGSTVRDAAETIDLHGATVAPAFADCHVHLAESGYLLGSGDLSDATSAETFERLVAALPHGVPYVYAGKLDDAKWPGGVAADPAVLERYHADACVLIARVDVHSSLVTQRTLALLGIDDRLAGIERDGAGCATGRLFGDANYEAQNRFFARIPEHDRHAAMRRAARLALERGAVHLHAQLFNLKTRDACAREIAALQTCSGSKIHPKICERDPRLAKLLDLPYVGGDVFLDGSLGSGTAATCAPYRDRAGNGTLMLTDAEVERFFSEAEQCGISAGVHAIGDRAIEQALSAWERVLDGKPSPQARHFIEHFEMASPQQLARAVRLGLFLSVQPQFDAVWGGTGGMYDARLGRERMQEMNALRGALDAGAVLCGGDDSPVCELAPLAGMAAACAHRSPEHRITPLEALTMYAYDAARFGHAESHTGAIGNGRDADFVVLDRDPFADGSFAQTRVLQTWSDGIRVFGEDL